MKKKKDLTEGDHSFKNWLRIVGKENSYLLMFVIFLAATIVSVFFPNTIGAMPDETWNLYIAGFTGLITILIGYKGLYQKWNDLKNGRVR